MNIYLLHISLLSYNEKIELYFEWFIHFININTNININININIS